MPNVIVKNDELIISKFDMDLSVRNKEAILNFSTHRPIKHYAIISQQTGITISD